MKEALANLLAFLLIFVAIAALFLANYWISSILVPGGKGLIFANPFSAALFPSLVGALVVAQYRAVHKPGIFRVTWVLLAAAFFFLLTLSIPVIQKTPPFRASDSTPVVDGRFLPLEDGSQILSTPPSAVLIPGTGTPMEVSARIQYDALNQRFVFPSEDPKNVGSTGPERAYFQYTPALVSLQTDFLALYTVLRNSAELMPFVYWFQAWAVTWIFLGIFFFFSFRTWPLVQVVLVLIAVRFALVFLVYAFWSIPALMDLWIPQDQAPYMRIWAPIVLVDVAAACLFFMTWVSKPHQQAGLS